MACPLRSGHWVSIVQKNIGGTSSTVENRKTLSSKNDYGIKLSNTKKRVLYKDQRRRCAICLCSAQMRELVVDHDHECCRNQVICGLCIRGLLCNSCNVWLSMNRSLGDD